MMKERYVDHMRIILLVACGVIINYLGAELAFLTGLPLFLDTIGTILVAVIAGELPGMVAGYVFNVIYCLEEPLWLYYCVFSLWVAFVCGRTAKKGYFKNIKYLPNVLVPVALVTGLFSEIWAMALNGFDPDYGVVGDIVKWLSARGIVLGNVFLTRFVINIFIEYADKLICLLAAYALLLTFSDLINNKLKFKRSGPGSVLSDKLTAFIVGSGTFSSLVIFLLSFYTFYELSLDSAAFGRLSVTDAAMNYIMFSSRVFAAILGLQLFIAAISIRYINAVILDPLSRITSEVREYSSIGDEERYAYSNKFTKLSIKTGDELEDLYESVAKTIADISEYIRNSHAHASELHRMQTQVINIMADIIESRDGDTGEHVGRTAGLVKSIAMELKDEGIYTDTITDDYINEIEIAAPLHDVGKIVISDTILNKPGKLTPEEFDIMKTHAAAGKDIIGRAIRNVGNSVYLELASDLAGSHHEWWDGSGYPQGLSGEEIPLSARIMAVADVYDALTSVRPYKRAFSKEEAMDIMRKETGSHFDPLVEKALEKVLEKEEEEEKREDKEELQES
ncbi:HD-GYP domain-containing protein [Butyrivibrio sp. MC2013]|uniref:HD-GYP domain-containing protein n=1 Tax=Butyrivibrio sp. MC2013 TaxID=1280686 RepID=UPI0004101860|nr:HD domain-containing phosphohydrolase [Butyrivibrio sp. MC2013]